MMSRETAGIWGRGSAEAQDTYFYVKRRGCLRCGNRFPISGPDSCGATHRDSAIFCTPLSLTTQYFTSTGLT